MKRRGFSIIAGVVALSFIVVGCAGRSEPAGGLPAEVPPDYVPTASGFLHRSCVIRLQPGEEIADQSARGLVLRTAAGATRLVPPCAYPRYSNTGGSFSVESSPSPAAPAAVAPAPAAAAAGVTARTSELHATYGEVDAFSKAMRSTWKVPADPPGSATQIALWPGLQNPKPTEWVLQPILQALGGPPWTIEPCAYFPASGNFPCTTAVTVNANDTIQGTVTGSGCDNNTHVCSTWTVQIADLTTGQSPQPLVIPSITKPAYRILTDLELYGVTSCDQLPGGALPSFATEWQGFDNVWHSAAADVFQGAASPFCFYDSWVAFNGSVWSLYLGWWAGYDPYPLTFDNMSTQVYTGLGDWAFGYYKSECASSDWVIGLSANTSTISAHSALCGYDGNINSKLVNPSWSVDGSAPNQGTRAALS